MTWISAAQALFAVVTIMGAGFAFLRLIAPANAAGPLAERLGLSWLLGTGLISLMVAALGALLDGGSLVAAVSASIAVLVLLGRKQTPRARSVEKRPGLLELLLLAILVSEVVAIGFYASKLGLHWDSLMIWEWKSRLAFLNGGSLPAGYFTSVTHEWSLPRYPLQLPYVGSWLYLCLGRFDQSWFRLIGPLYYLATAGIIAGACQRLQGSRAVGLGAAAAMFFVPYFFSGTWGMFAGYADVPLAALLVAAISRIPALNEDSSAAQAKLLGIVAALLPWMKREGKYLWIAVIFIALIQVWRLKAWRRVPWIVLPGVVMIAGFELWMALVDALPLHNAVALSFDQLPERLGRSGFVAQRLLSAAMDMEAWSLLWPGAAAAVIALAIRRKYQLAVTFGGALTLCWLLLGVVYIVGYPDNLEAMISITIHRIVLQFAPLAVLTLAIAVPQDPSKS